MIGTYLKISLFVTVTLYSLRKLIEIFDWKKCSNNVSLKNKIVIVTGANSGIGYETTKELAKRGALVILACRDMTKATEAVQKIRKQLGFNANLYPLHLDVSSLTSILAFIKEVKKSFKNVHILVNNAGVYYPSGVIQTNSDGIEIHFATNYLGHFYLTYFLINGNILIQDRKKPSRVINVTSRQFECGQLDFLNWTKKGPSVYNDKFYHNSKLAQVYFNQAIADHFSYFGIHSYAACLGPTYTNLFRHKKFSIKIIFALPFLIFLLRSAKMSAQTVIYCATAPNLDSETGSIYYNCRKYIPRIRIQSRHSKDFWFFTLSI